jgi:hypothetical protein
VGAFGGRARFDLRERFGRVEERALHHAVRLEQPIATLSQLLDLGLQQRTPATEIGEHALARAARFFEHGAALLPRVLDDRLGLLARALALLLGDAVVGRAHLGRARLGLAHDLGRDALGLLGADPEDVVGFGAEPVGLGLRLVHHAGGALFGLAADVVGRLAGGPQQAGGLLAERVEQLLLVERLRRVEPLLEIVDDREELVFAVSRRDEIFGHAPEERTDLGLGITAERGTERAVGDFLGAEARRAVDDSLPPLALSHAYPQSACASIAVDARAHRSDVHMVENGHARAIAAHDDGRSASDAFRRRGDRQW